jgi:hypothetical protein
MIGSEAPSAGAKQANVSSTSRKIVISPIGSRRPTTGEGVEDLATRPERDERPNQRRRWTGAEEMPMLLPSVMQRRQTRLARHCAAPSHAGHSSLSMRFLQRRSLGYRPFSLYVLRATEVHRAQFPWSATNESSNSMPRLRLRVDLVWLRRGDLLREMAAAPLTRR